MSAAPSKVSALAHGAPAVLIALLPKCPVCWFSYASALGLAGVAPTAWKWALPATVVLLAAVVVPLVLRRSPAGLWPAALAVAGGAIAIAGRGSPWAMAGAPLLVIAALWQRRALTRQP